MVTEDVLLLEERKLSLHCKHVTLLLF